MLKPLTPNATVSGNRMVIKIEWAHGGPANPIGLWLYGKGTCEDTARRWPSARKEESHHQELTLLGLHLGLPVSRTGKINSYCLSHLAYGILLWQPELLPLCVSTTRKCCQSQCLNSSLVFIFIKLKCDRSLKSQVFPQVLYKNTALPTPAFSSSSSPLSFGGYVSVYLQL